MQSGPTDSFDEGRLPMQKDHAYICRSHSKYHAYTQQRVGCSFHPSVPSLASTTGSGAALTTAKTESERVRGPTAHENSATAKTREIERNEKQHNRGCFSG